MSIEDPKRGIKPPSIKIFYCIQKRAKEYVSTIYYNIKMYIYYDHKYCIPVHNYPGTLHEIQEKFILFIWFKWYLDFFNLVLISIICILRGSPSFIKTKIVTKKIKIHQSFFIKNPFLFPKIKYLIINIA